MYRNNVRKMIQDWLNVVSTKKNQEWMIVHVTETETKKSGIFNVSTMAKVHDRIKTDFNLKKERLTSQ